MGESATKRCVGRCGGVKPLDDFYLNLRRKDGRQSECKQCQNDRGRETRASVPTVARRTATRDRDRARYADNPEAGRVKSRTYYAAHREARIAKTKAYQDGLRAKVFGFYGERCACCGSTGNLQIDHVYGGGSDHRRAFFGTSNSCYRLWVWLIRNDFPAGFQTLCGLCNICKGEAARCVLHADPATLTVAEREKLRMRRKNERHLARKALRLAGAWLDAGLVSPANTR
jgi:hypothetical protein